MPLKSKAQMRKLAMLEKQGRVPKGTLHRWAEETPNMKSLPERKGGGKRGKGKKAAKTRKRKKV